MNGETELTAAFNLCSLCFDKAGTQSQIVTDLNGVKTSSDMLATFPYVRLLVRQGEVEVLAVNGKDNVSDKLTKGYESNPQHITELVTV